jgi:hypothetical protein
VDRFFNYLFGRHFKLVTDNRPLTRIFYQNAKLPSVSSGRLLRYAIFLSLFDYEIENIVAGCLFGALIVQKEFSGDLAINN